MGDMLQSSPQISDDIRDVLCAEFLLKAFGHQRDAGWVDAGNVFAENGVVPVGGTTAQRDEAGCFVCDYAVVEISGFGGQNIVDEAGFNGIVRVEYVSQQFLFSLVVDAGEVRTDAAGLFLGRMATAAIRREKNLSSLRVSLHCDRIVIGRYYFAAVCGGG